MGKPSVVRDSKQSMALPQITSYQDRPSVEGDREQSMAMPLTTQPSGQALSAERQRAINGNGFDHSAVRAGPQCRETEWQCHCLRPHSYQGRSKEGMYEERIVHCSVLYIMNIVNIMVCSTLNVYLPVYP